MMRTERRIGLLMSGIVMFLPAIIFLFVSILYNGPAEKLSEKDFITISGAVESAGNRGQDQMFIFRLQGDSSIYSVSYNDLNVEILTPTILREQCVQGAEVEIICYNYKPYVYKEESNDLKNNLWYSVQDLKINGIQYKILEESIQQEILDIKKSKNDYMGFSISSAIIGVVFVALYFIVKKTS